MAKQDATPQDPRVAIYERALRQIAEMKAEWGEDMDEYASYAVGMAKQALRRGEVR